jgi:hypothetical protein
MVPLISFFAIKGYCIYEDEKLAMLIVCRVKILFVVPAELDSLVEYRKDREFRECQQQLALSAQDAE